MKAKYATTCAVCSVRIQPGEEIAPAGGGRSAGWAHAALQAGVVRRTAAESGRQPARR